jgi:hypothetical protein
MNFANLKSLTIPEGNVAKITQSGTVLWGKVKELKNYFIPEQATLNVVMGANSLSARAGYVWSNPIPVDLTKESPFRIKVEGTKITEDTGLTQKIWLSSDENGTVKTSAGVLQVGANWSGTVPLLEDGTIYADYNGGAKLADSIINQIKAIRIGFKFSDTTIASADELKNVKITIPSDML